MHETIFGDQLIYAVVSAWAIQKIKELKYVSFVTQETTKVNRLLALVFSALGTAGILVGHSWTSETYTLTITISGLTLEHSLDFAWHTFGQYIYAKVFYHAAFKPTAAKLPATG